MEYENDYEPGTPEWAVREGLNVLLGDRPRLLKI